MGHPRYRTTGRRSDSRPRGRVPPLKGLGNQTRRFPTPEGVGYRLPSRKAGLECSQFWESQAPEEIAPPRQKKAGWAIGTK
jgi:hypothetical protein